MLRYNETIRNKRLEGERATIQWVNRRGFQVKWVRIWGREGENAGVEAWNHETVPPSHHSLHCTSLICWPHPPHQQSALSHTVVQCARQLVYTVCSNCKRKSKWSGGSTRESPPLTAHSNSTEISCVVWGCGWMRVDVGMGVGGRRRWYTGIYVECLDWELAILILIEWSMYWTIAAKNGYWPKCWMVIRRHLLD